MDLKRVLTSFYNQNHSPVSWKEHWRSAIGGACGGAFVAFLAKFVGEFTQINEWAMASLGASALLIFVLPSSPMAQPRAVIGGNIVAALVGVTCAVCIPDPRIGIPIAIGVSIIGMLFFNCLHAPAAATALSAVLGHIIIYRFIFFPVLIDTILLVLAGIIYNRATGKDYPHFNNLPSRNSNHLGHVISQNLSPETQEINEALKQYDEYINLDSGDLAKIIGQVERNAYRGKLSAILCSSIMTSKVIAVKLTTPI